MSVFAQRAEEYLRLRRALGHDLADAARLLPRFVAYLGSIGASAITVEAALAWVQRPDADPASSVWSRRMTVVRGFARHMSGIDPATQVPPLGLVTFRQHWCPPFIYSAADIEALMAEVPRVVPTSLRAATFTTMIGLLAATGLRVGEVISLGRSDINWIDGIATVRGSKFGNYAEPVIMQRTLLVPRFELLVCGLSGVERLGIIAAPDRGSSSVPTREGMIMARAVCVQVTGPLAQYAAGYQNYLVERGYASYTVAVQLRLMAHVSGWLARRGLDSVDLTVARGEHSFARGAAKVTRIRRR